MRPLRTATASKATSSAASEGRRASHVSAARRRRRAFSACTASSGSPNAVPVRAFTSQKVAMLFGPIPVASARSAQEA